MSRMKSIFAVLLLTTLVVGAVPQAQAKEGGTDNCWRVRQWADAWVGR